MDRGREGVPLGGVRKRGGVRPARGGPRVAAAARLHAEQRPVRGGGEGAALVRGEDRPQRRRRGGGRVVRPPLRGGGFPPRVSRGREPQQPSLGGNAEARGRARRSRERGGPEKAPRRGAHCLLTSSGSRERGSRSCRRRQCVVAPVHRMRALFEDSSARAASAAGGVGRRKRRLSRWRERGGAGRLALFRVNRGGVR